jgi:hypothetical protein
MARAFIQLANTAPMAPHKLLVRILRERLAEFLLDNRHVTGDDRRAIRRR